MDFKESKIKGLFEIIPRVFHDERGYFFESFSDKLFKANVANVTFVQDNQSFSTKRVLRGLHLQKPPFAQGKLVRVISGSVVDVVVDIRHGSSSFGQYETFLLTAEKQNMVYVPEGFAHGFATLEDAIFIYKCTNFYDKTSEAGIIFNDTDLNINWGIENPLVSEKDLELPTFKELISSI
jgi:dTDP-4-dehydrorhamnose 3,5-epimerase